MPHRRAVGNAGAGGTGRTGPSARLWGAAPPTPPSRRSARCAPLGAHPPTLGFSLCGGGAPTPPPDQRTRRGLRRRTELPMASGSLAPCGREGGGEGCAARQRGEMEPHAPIGSAARSRAATARASAAGICFDRDAGYLAGPPHPHPGGGRPPARPGFFLHVGAVSIGTQDTSQGPHAPDRTMARLSPSLTAPCSSSRREGAGPPSRLVQKARSAPFRRRFAKVSRGRELA